MEVVGYICHVHIIITSILIFVIVFMLQYLLIFLLLHITVSFIFIIFHHTRMVGSQSHSRVCMSCLCVCTYMHACFVRVIFYFSLTLLYCSNGGRNAFLRQITFNLVKMMQTNIYCVNVIYLHQYSQKEDEINKRNDYSLEGRNF